MKVFRRSLGSSIGNNELEADAVATTNIQDDAVTLAKLAGGSANKLIGFDASGDPTEVDKKTQAFDDFSSYASDAAIEAAYIPSPDNNEMRGDAANDQIICDHIRDGTGDLIYKDLQDADMLGSGNNLDPYNWTVQFDVTFGTDSAGASSPIFMVVLSNNTEKADQAQDAIGIFFRAYSASSTFEIIASDNADLYTPVVAKSHTFLAGTTYKCLIERKSRTDIWVNLYEGTSIYQARARIPEGIDDLRYFKICNYVSSSSGSWEGNKYTNLRVDSG